ncbi:MAG: uracil-DNA glycosylase, partial [Gallionella sp.]|nr:uracil-DNA glycosylase [Gallionella sp.]
MDRNEAVLRELNLYPQWVRRNAPAPFEDVGLKPDLPPAPVVVQEAQETQVSGYTALTRPTETAQSLPPGRGKDRMGVESPTTSTPSPALPLQGGGSIGDLGWSELKQQVRDCTACKLRAGCTQTVFGAGDENADWLFVGEGPGEEEDLRGEPFVGQAGKLLDNMLLAIKLKRGKSVYIANVVKCRPPGNRNPDAEEIAQCLPYLHRQIELIKPKVIVALGKTASAALLGDDAPLGTLRGRLHDFNGIPLVAN